MPKDPSKHLVAVSRLQLFFLMLINHLLNLGTRFDKHVFANTRAGYLTTRVDSPSHVQYETSHMLEMEKKVETTNQLLTTYKS